MNVRAQKSGRHKDVRDLVAADTRDRTADHLARIALTAYFIAEKRGFEPGHALDDWLAAEAAVGRAERQPRMTKPI